MSILKDISEMGVGNYVDYMAHSYNVFRNKEPTLSANIGATTAHYAGRTRSIYGSGDRNIVDVIVERFAVDAASVKIQHVKVDEFGRYSETIPNSWINYCFDIEANRDQAGRNFRQNIYESLLDEGYIAVCITDSKQSIWKFNTVTGETLRIGKIMEWAPNHVKVRLYEEDTGQIKDIWYPKQSTVIVQNPFYEILNRQNSTAQRLIKKLQLLDQVDEATGAGKLDMIIQLPYALKTAQKKIQAEERRKSIEDQLSNTRLGIAYTDATEHVIQLNRSLENNLLKQIEYLTSMLYSQLGITPEILNGTADEATMNNYMSRIIEPIVSAVIEEVNRKFLTKTARTQGQAIIAIQQPFRFVPVGQMADLADKLTRNEILTPNEVRQIMGMKPAEDPQADELRNRNINQGNDEKQEEEMLPEGEDVPAEEPEEVSQDDGSIKWEDLV